MRNNTRERYETGSELGGYVHLNVEAEPDEAGLRGRVDLIEAYAFYRPALTDTFHLDFRGGVFFPPISLEHSGLV